MNEVLHVNTLYAEQIWDDHMELVIYESGSYFEIILEPTVSD